MNSDDFPSAREGYDRALRAIDARLSEVARQVSTISDRAAELLEAATAEGARPVRGDLARLEHHLRGALSSQTRPMDGIGVATIPGYLADEDYWLEWWRVNPRGGLEFVMHMLNPRQDSFYDYPSRAWFSAPITSSMTTVTGPYVDAGGTNASTVTLAAPLLIRGRVVGVTGADIPVARFETDLLEAGSERPLVLVNRDLRVTASTSPQHLPGDLLGAPSVHAWGRDAEETRVGFMDWMLFALT